MIRNRVLFAASFAALFSLASAASAQSPAVSDSIPSIIGEALATLLGLAVTAFLAWLRSHLKDQAAAKVISTALHCALGVMQQTNTAGAPRLLDAAVMAMPGLSPAMREGLHYVMTNAGDELARFGIAPDAVAAKLRARIGLLNIQTNLATAASPDPSPKPLDPVLPPVPIAR